MDWDLCAESDTSVDWSHRVIYVQCFFFVDIFWLAGVAPKWDHLGHRKTVLFFTFFYWSINNPSIYTWDITSSSWEAEEQVMRETTKKLARKRHLGKKKRKKGERATSPSSVSTCTHLTIWAAKETGRFTPQHRIGRKLLAAASVIHPCPLLLLLRLLWRSIFHRPEEETFSASVTCHHMTLGRFSSYFSSIYVFVVHTCSPGPRNPI